MKFLLSLFLTLTTSIAFSQYVVSTEGGSGLSGHADGAANLAQFNRPVGIAVDDDQNLIIADFYNECIRRIDTNGIVSTIAGNPGISGFADGNGSVARFNKPGGVAVDQFGNIFVTDNFNFRIRKIDPQGNVTTIAGNGTPGYVDGAAATAQFNVPRDLVVDPSNGSILIVDRNNNVIRELDTNGIVSTFAGDGVAGNIDGSLTQSRFDFPGGIAIDQSGLVYIADQFNHSIRVIKPNNGTVSTVVGTGRGGFNDGPTATAQLNRPVNVDVDENGTLYIADYNNNRIRSFSNGMLSTLAGDGTRAFRDGPAQNSQIGETFGLAVYNSMNIYFNDATAERVRKINDPSIITNLPENINANSGIELNYQNDNFINYKSEQAFRFELFSIDGKLIFEGRRTAGNGSIQLAKLTSGFYVIRAVSAKGESASLKISKP